MVAIGMFSTKKRKGFDLYSCFGVTKLRKKVESHATFANFFQKNCSLSGMINRERTRHVSSLVILVAKI
jgi:hypothetical protein